ncbi:FAD-dependent oxidoreductase [Coraliomargarita parva]|uniref:FAD-dependent oxidoreductase n=1 Tax=Coraliomargarita parva TaxID=3014050 RepID=UPI0022B321BE|nr:FAD-dependent oxidoreductase [Coraliomargarita parva]
MTIQTECLVIGGGPAGYGAAWAASEMGVKTIIAERYGFLGGMGAAASLSSFINYHQNGNTDLSDGVYRRLIRRLHQSGAAYRAGDPHVDFLDVEELKVAMEASLAEVGTRILYHCAFDHITRTDNGFRVRMLGKGGEILIQTRYLIDATGDADVCAKAGTPVSYGKNGDKDMAQPMSMIVQLSGFDPVMYSDSGYTIGANGHVCETSGWSTQIAEAREAGEWSIPKDSIAMWWSSPKDPSHVFINGTRIQGLLGCDPEQLSKAETEGRRQAHELAAFFRKYIPGFEHSHLLSTGPQIGVRETRRIVGNYTLSSDDVIHGRYPADSIVECSYPIDIHAPKGIETQIDVHTGIHYGIPYRCLTIRGEDRLIAAGRCISADHEAAGSFRVMPVCMSLGEAAGTAVGLASTSGQSLEKMSGATVRQTMDQRRGAPLTAPDSHAFILS